MATLKSFLQNSFNQAYENSGLRGQNVIENMEDVAAISVMPGEAITEIIALTIANTLSGAETYPVNILCLTGEDFPTFVLKKQLEKLAGPDVPNIIIHTFSSFCEEVIIENAGLSLFHSLRPVSILESIQLFKKIITAFPKDHPLKRFRSDVFHEINNLKCLFAFMKKEGWTTTSLLEKINGIPTEFFTMDRNDPVSQTATLLEKFEMREKSEAAILEFDHYQNGLLVNDWYDSDDPLYLVINALEADGNLLSGYQEKYTHILVSGYEEMGHPAYDLLKLLAGGDKRPNLLVVKHAQSTIPLNELTTCMPPEEFEIKQPTPEYTRLYKHLSGQELLNTCVINSYDSIGEEMAGITNQVNDLLQQNIAAKTIAVIYSADDYCESMEHYFIAKKIPCYNCRTIDILGQPFTKKILKLLRYISTEQEVPNSGDDLLFEILHFDFFKVPPIEIEKLAVAANRSKYNKTPSAIRKILFESAHAPSRDLFDTGMDKGLQELSNIFEKLIEDTSTASLRQIFENIIRHAQVRRYVDQSIDRAWLMQLLEALTDFVNIETERNSQLQLNELIADIETMEQSALPIPVTRIIGDNHDVHLIQPSEADLTEYAYVFIAGANAPKPLKIDWLTIIGKLNGKTHTFPYNIRENQQRDLIQLLNTALTGNTLQLIVSFAKKNKYGKVLEPAKFLTDILLDHAIPVNHVLEKAEEPSNQELLQAPGLQPEIAQPDETFITPILKKFVLNVSALNSYLDCPLGFYYKNLLRVPAGKNEAMGFGRAIHDALENLFKKMSAGRLATYNAPDAEKRKYQFSSAAEMAEDFNRYMYSHRSHFSKEAFERRIQYGRDVLKNYFDHYINSWNKVVSVERNIHGVTFNGVPLKGKLDKLEFNGKEVTIVDYKSGAIEKARPKMKPPQEGLPYGGDYWRQAVFYCILVDNYAQKDWKVISTEFDFIEPDNKKVYQKERIMISAPDIETVKQQITVAWNKIQSRQFYTGCGKQDCQWCNFVKDNKLAVALHQKEFHPANH